MLSKTRLTANTLLLASLLASVGCYAAMHPLAGPHGCNKCCFDECRLGDALDRVCTGRCFSGCASPCHCGEPVDLFMEDECISCSAEVCGEVCQPYACGCGIQGKCPLHHCHWSPGCNVEPGPPPRTFYPQLPPKFLPVPTRPIFAATNPHAPAERDGSVEVHWSPQLSSPR